MELPAAIRLRDVERVETDAAEALGRGVNAAERLRDLRGWVIARGEGRGDLDATEIAVGIVLDLCAGGQITLVLDGGGADLLARVVAQFTGVLPRELRQLRESLGVERDDRGVRTGAVVVDVDREVRTNTSGSHERDHNEHYREAESTQGMSRLSVQQ